MEDIKILRKKKTWSCKKEHGCEQYKNLSEDKKQKLVSIEKDIMKCRKINLL